MIVIINKVPGPGVRNEIYSTSTMTICWIAVFAQMIRAGAAYKYQRCTTTVLCSRVTYIVDRPEGFLGPCHLITHRLDWLSRRLRNGDTTTRGLLSIPFRP